MTLRAAGEVSQMLLAPGALTAREKTLGPPTAFAVGGLSVFVGVAWASVGLMIVRLVAVSLGIASPSMVTRRVTRRVGWW